MDEVIVFRKPFLKRKLIKGERVVVIQFKNRQSRMGLFGQIISLNEKFFPFGAGIMTSSAS